MGLSSIVIAIITSFIASVVFFLFFEYIPKKKDYKKIRPRIEVELMEISEQLFFFIECPMKHAEHSPSFFQGAIREEKLTQSDFELGLYNKCLNESYLFDKNASKLMIVGDGLKEQANVIESNIQRVLMNQGYLSAEEILILEDVIRLLHTYPFDTNAVSYLGGVKIYPVNPTISYMQSNFFELYKLYRELRAKLYNCKEIEHEERQGKNRYYRLQWEYIIYLIGKEDYDNAEKRIQYLLKRYDTPTAKSEMNALRLQINVKRNQIDLAKGNLLTLLSEPRRLGLVYQRGYVECIRENEELMALCKTCCAANEIDEWDATVLRESKAKEDFLAQNRQLKEYYEKKTEA